jgi:hypothetical protein
MARRGKRPGAAKSLIRRKVVFDRVTEDLAHRIAVLADNRGVGVSDVLREVLELYSRNQRLRARSGGAETALPMSNGKKK